MKKLILFGDSLFAQISKSELLLLEKILEYKYDVYNCAVGGWDTNDLVKKSPYIAQLKADVLLLSIGTNDASHWKQVELSKFKENLVHILNEFSNSSVVFFLPPPVNETWQPSNKRRLQKTMVQYYEAAKETCEKQNIQYIASWELFLPLVEPNDTFHVEDGVHISDSGYKDVFEAIRRVLL